MLVIYTKDQERVIENFNRFIFSRDDFFIINGAAGTGKTFLINELIQITKENNYKYILLSSTGRGARFLKQSTNKFVQTVHREIYQFESKKIQEDSNKPTSTFKLKQNENEKTVYFIDEASMLTDVESQGELMYEENKVLSDLIKYIKSSLENKIVFIGDNCQLPPINMNLSPAISLKYLNDNYKLIGKYMEMNEVYRHSILNPIYQSATYIRDNIKKEKFNEMKLIFEKGYFEGVDNEVFINKYIKELDNNNSIIVCFSNDTCNFYNNRILKLKYGHNQLTKGAKVINNNNTYIDGEPLLSGDIGEVLYCGEKEEETIEFKRGTGIKSYTFSVRYAEIKFEDTIYKGYINENYLMNNTEKDELRSQAIAVYLSSKYNIRKNKDKYDINTQQKLVNIFNTDKYLTALNIKFAYAITCHKAQGGQWDKIFVDNNFGKSKKSKEYFRWIYTAITRGIKQSYITNYKEFNTLSEVKEVCVQGDIIEELSTGGMEELNKEEINILNVIESQVKKKLFISIANSLRKYGLSIAPTSKSIYQDIYIFRDKNGETCKMSIWLDKKGIVSSYKIINSTNINLKDIIDIEIQKLTNKKITENTSNINVDIDLNNDIEREIYETVNYKLLGSNINIKSIEHLNYRERYTFNEGIEEVTIDLIYNKKGSITKPKLLEKETNSLRLIDRINKILLNKKEAEYDR